MGIGLRAVDVVSPSSGTDGSRICRSRSGTRSVSTRRRRTCRQGDADRRRPSPEYLFARDHPRRTDRGALAPGTNPRTELALPMPRRPLPRRGCGPRDRESGGRVFSDRHSRRHAVLRSLRPLRRRALGLGFPPAAPRRVGSSGGRRPRRRVIANEEQRSTSRWKGPTTRRTTLDRRRPGVPSRGAPRFAPCLGPMEAVTALAEIPYPGSTRDRVRSLERLSYSCPSSPLVVLRALARAGVDRPSRRVCTSSSGESSRLLAADRLPPLLRPRVLLGRDLVWEGACRSRGPWRRDGLLESTARHGDRFRDIADGLASDGRSESSSAARELVNAELGCAPGTGVG